MCFPGISVTKVKVPLDDYHLYNSLSVYKKERIVTLFNILLILSIMATARDGNNGERPPRRRQARADIDHTFLEDSAEDTGKTLHTKDGQV